ncbi:hypothetical protein EDD15DRAFT_2194467 [Pisolithus albus]|nr:hypothetical protein EDD15DRAFT_2194467 [Pisolithus albus]
MDGMIKGLFIERQRPRLKHDWQSSLFDLYLVVDYKVSGNEYHQGMQWTLHNPGQILEVIDATTLDWETFYAAADDSDPVWSGLSYQCDITKGSNWRKVQDCVKEDVFKRAVLQQRLSIQAPHVLIIVAQTVKRLTGQCMAVSVQHMYNELSSSRGQGVVPDKIDVSYLMASRMLTVSSIILKAPPQFPPYTASQVDQLFPLTLCRSTFPPYSVQAQLATSLLHAHEELMASEDGVDDVYQG